METDEQTVDQTSSEGNVKENGESEKDEKSAEEETEAAPAVKHLAENELFSQYYLVGPYVWHFAITHYHVSTHPIVDTSGIILGVVLPRVPAGQGKLEKVREFDWSTQLNRKLQTQVSDTSKQTISCSDFF